VSWQRPYRPGWSEAQGARAACCPGWSETRGARQRAALALLSNQLPSPRHRATSASLTLPCSMRICRCARCRRLGDSDCNRARGGGPAGQRKAVRHAYRCGAESGAAIQCRRGVRNKMRVRHRTRAHAPPVPGTRVRAPLRESSCEAESPGTIERAHSYPFSRPDFETNCWIFFMAPAPRGAAPCHHHCWKTITARHA
jgi:hypothetical protein